MIKMILLVSSINTGDVSHANEVADKMLSQGVEVVKIDTNSKDMVGRYLLEVQKIPGNDRYITVGIGPKGQDAIKQLDGDNKLDKERSYTVLSTHQYTSDIRNLVMSGAINHLAVPAATISFSERESIRGVNSSLLFAVPSKNPATEELKTAYDNWVHADKPNLDDKHIVVMLPGDAPIAKEEKEGDVQLADGSKVRLFSEASARELFDDVKALWERTGRQYKVALQNGPRVGKYNNSGEIVCAHEYEAGENPEKAVDEISKQFKKWLEEEGIEHSFFNFAFEVNQGRKTGNSVYNQLLYVASQEENYFIIPGESVSMLGQIASYIPANRNIVFKPSSMNEAHNAIFNAVVQEQYVSYFGRNGGVIKPDEPKRRLKDDTGKLTYDILEKFRDLEVEKGQERSK